MVNAGIVIESIQLCSRGDLQQVLIAGHVLGQQQQMGRLSVCLGLVGHPVMGQISLHPDDRLDTLIFGLGEEIDHSEHGAVIGDPQSGHLQFFGAGDQLGNMAETIQQGILGMHMQMDKIRHTSGSPHSSQINYRQNNTGCSIITSEFHNHTQGQS